VADQYPQFLFLCGVGRSGTTILRTSLGLHEQIYYNGHENNLIQDVVSVALRNCTMKSRKNSMVVGQREYDAAFRNLICRLIWPNPELANRPVHMAAINPTPEQLDAMRQLFPTSKYIGLFRNGIEVVSSRKEFQPFSWNEFATHCDVWNRSADIFAWGRQNVDCFLPMRHEWFYEPDILQQKLKRLYSWLSIDHSTAPEKNILGTLWHPTSSGLVIRPPKFKECATEQKRQYFLSKRKRWRNWTQPQRVAFAKQCGESMSLLGYQIPWS
jgi:hypothetical protein